MATPSGYRGFRASLTRGHDGDSFWVLADTGFGQRAEPELRLADVHAPELVAMRLPPRRQPGSREAREFVAGWIDRLRWKTPARRWYLSVGVAMTTTVEPDERTTFRRYVAVVFAYESWPLPWVTPMPTVDVSLNHDVAVWLAGHPEWPAGD